MDAQQAVPVIPGIDLAFRPRTYFGPIPAETHVLAHTMGHERRELLRAQLASDSDDPMLDLIAGLFDLDRESLGQVHPGLMGGEYLPPFLDDETEIPRISLASTTADQISIRAQRLPDGIAYRIVDEYGDMVEYVCHPARSALPLTLGELVALIDGAAPDGGAALAYVYVNVAADPANAERLRSFVRVSSEFYPQLAPYYDARIAGWFAGERAVYRRRSRRRTAMSNRKPNDPSASDTAPDGGGVPPAFDTADHPGRADTNGERIVANGPPK
jgi:hypothetical protein